jgi:hypothetical protein
MLTVEVDSTGALLLRRAPDARARLRPICNPEGGAA